MTQTQIPALQHWGDYDLDDPFPLFAEVLEQGPVHDITLKDGVRAFLVVSYDAAREALNHPGLSKDMEAAMDAEDGVVVGGPARSRLRPPHAQRRPARPQPDARTGHARLHASPGWPASRAGSTTTVASLLDDLAAADGPVDLVEGFALPLPFSVIGELLGIDAAGQSALVGWFATLMAPYSGSTPPPEAVAASDGIVGYLNDLVDQRLASPTEDLVGDLARSANAGAITRKELLSSLFQLIVAGHHTTTSLIGNGVAALLAHPDQRDALVADPALIPKAVEEFLRYDAPVPHSTFRYATEDVDDRGDRHPGRRAGDRQPRRGRPRPVPPSRTRTSSTYAASRPTTWRSATASTTASARGSPGSRRSSRSAACSPASRGIRLAVDPSELHWNHGDGLVLRGLSSLPVHLS